MIERPANVEVAIPSDVEELYWFLLNDLYFDNGIFERSPLKVLKVVQTVCNGEAAIGGVIREEGKIVASVGLVLTQPWYSEEWMPTEVWLFVHPDHRKGTHYGDDLFMFEKWHREDLSHRVGKEFILQTSVTTLNRLEAKTRFWRRHARHVGSTFWIEGDHVRQQRD